MSDRGIGPLVLGMTLKQVQATGWIKGPDPDVPDGEEACKRFLGRHGVERLYFEGKTGRLIIIAVDKTVRTDKGVGVGDTYRRLHASYPDADAGEGRVYVDATGAPFRAFYRFGTNGDSVIYPDDIVKEIALQAANQPCYE